MFLRGPLRRLRATKNTIVSWLLNFRICLFLKSALMKWPWWRQRQWQKKTRGSHKVVGKTTTLNVHHAFLYISLPSVHDYNLKMPNFTFCGEQEHKTTTLFFFSSTLIQSVTTNYSRKNWQHLMNWTRWNKPDKVWSVKYTF